MSLMVGPLSPVLLLSIDAGLPLEAAELGREPGREPGLPRRRRLCLCRCDPAARDGSSTIPARYTPAKAGNGKPETLEGYECKQKKGHAVPGANGFA